MGIIADKFFKIVHLSIRISIYIFPRMFRQIITIFFSELYHHTNTKAIRFFLSYCNICSPSFYIFCYNKYTLLILYLKLPIVKIISNFLLYNSLNKQIHFIYGTFWFHCLMYAFHFSEYFSLEKISE